MPRIYSFNDFIKFLYGQEGSVFTCVTGPNGSGKTEFNLLQIERIHDLGLGHKFGSNMPIPEALEPNFDMDFIEDFDTLEQTCRMLNESPSKHGMKKYIFFLSELGKFAPKDQPWLNVKFIEKLQTVRKYGLSMLTDAIDRVDSRILSPRFFNGEFEKPYPTNPKFARYIDFRNGRTFTFKDIPKCKMWFDTYYSANFYMEPQTKDGAVIPLNYEHEIAFRYAEGESWKSIGIPTQEGKRCVLKVLKFHKAHCLHDIKAFEEFETPINTENTKDSVKVTE